LDCASPDGLMIVPSSRQDFPANRSASLVEGLPRKTNAGSGRKLLELFAIYDRSSSCWRTCRVSFLEGWEMFSATWPTAGTMRSGKCYRLPPWELHISAGGSGYWPTPATRDYRSGKSRREYGNSRPLSEVVLWATPNARDAKGSPGEGYMARRGHRCSLPAQVKDQDASDRLNPDWVETLMGYRIGWTRTAGPPPEGRSNTSGSHRGRSSSVSRFADRG
jgi:hypothetical protein